MKKRLVFTLLCIAFFYGNAQNNSYYNRMQYVFGNIDKTKVTTGYLKEFGIRFNEVEAYNGVISTNNLVDQTQWQSLYSSLYTMRVGTVTQNMAAPNTVFNNLKAQQAGTSDILLTAQYYNYQQYKTNAVSNGDVTVSNDRIYDVSGRNPYDTKTIFGVAPLEKQLQGNTFTFKLPSGLIYTNTSLTLSQVQMDFGDGNGYQTITLNTAKNITYSSGGEKELKVKFVFSGGPTLYSHSKIWVDYIAPQGGAMARFNGSGATTHVITGDPWQGSSATGLITVELAPSHSQLTKPLIVVEGFDPDNRFNYRSLINSANLGGLNILINNSPNLTLNQAIEDEDYDLVFVDFLNSTDYIQRNAYMVEKVIAWVNTEKNKNNNPNAEENVVLGMSMGGLVARYALRHLEIDGDPNTNHDTKLYVSHDAPHQGANVPLAFQAMVRHMVGEQISIPVFLSLFDVNILDIADFAPELEDALTLLQSPAVQQMLIYQLQGIGNNVSIDTNTLQGSFATEYANMGYPMQNGIRNIAIANGSECGTPLGFADNATLLDINDTVGFQSGLGFILTVLNAFTLNPLKFVSSVLTTDSDIHFQFNLKALPNQESKQIYKGKIFIRKEVLFFIIIHEPLIDEKTVNSSSNMLPLDNANGGIYDIETLGVELPVAIKDAFLETEFDFIPTYSSLDIGGGNQTIGIGDLNKAYSPLSPPKSPKNTPFDNFFTNELGSEQHIQFTLNNGNWLMDELDNVNGGAFYTCVSACSNNLDLRIQGEDKICIGASKTYTLSNLTSHINVNWSISLSSTFTLSPSGNNSVIVTPIGNASRNATLTASITTDCGVLELNKVIQVGTEGIDSVFFENGIYEEGYFCSSHNGNKYTLYPKIKGNSYQYRILGFPSLNVLYTSAVSSSNSGTVYYTPSPGWYVFEARIINSCGTSYWSGHEVEYVDCSNSGGGEHRFAVFPNPSSQTVNIVRKSKKGLSGINAQNDNITQLRLYDFSSTVLIDKRNGSLEKLNISRLRAGIYYLEITSGNKTEVHKIVVEK